MPPDGLSPPDRRPENIVVERFPGRLTLRLRHRSFTPVVLAAIALVLSMALLLSTMMTPAIFSGGLLPFTVALIVVLFLVLGALYALAAGLRNEVIISVTPQQISRRFGPLPVPGGHTWRLASVTSFRTDTTTESTPSGRFYRYHVIVCSDAGNMRLVGDLVDARQADFVVRQLTRCHRDWT